MEEDGMKFNFSEPPILNEHSFDQDFEFFVKVLENPDEKITNENID